MIAREPVGEPIRGERLRALVIDDDELDRLNVRRFLRAAGFDVSVKECEDAESALSAIDGDPFDCVLLDFNLPTRDGLFVLQQLRARGHRMPVIVLTGQDDAEIAAALMKHGASDYLSKVSLSAERLGHSIRTTTRLHRAEAATRDALESLRASEELNRRILASSADCIIVLDLDGKVLSMGEGGARAIGIDLGMVVGRHWLDVWTDADRETAVRAFEQAKAGEKSRVIGPWRAANGSVVWFDSMLTPILGADGRVEKVLEIARDITELKQRENFEQQLVGIVSHDLRNPLNAILLGVDLLLRRELVNEKASRSLLRIRSSADRAARMIHDLLDFTHARLGGGIPIQRAPTDLAQRIAQVVDEISLAWGERDIEWSGPERLEGQWDADRICQVVSNLLSNSLQYSPPETKVRCALKAEDDSALIEIHNRGEPIPESLMPRLFEPLQRGARAADNSGRSIGLGLYIVRQLVHAHGGTIQVRSSEEEGTTFSVRLPLG